MRDLQETFSIISNVWKFMKEFHDPKDDPEFWKELVEEADKVCRNNPDPFCESFLLVCIDDIDRRFRQQIDNPYISKDPLKDTYDRLRKART